MASKSELGDSPKDPLPRIPIPKIRLPKIPVSKIPHLSPPAIRTPAFEFPNIEIPPNPLLTSVEANYASEFYKRLVDWINRFNDSLDDKHEVGVKLVSFGHTVVFHLEDLGYWNPSLISFRGKTDEGNPVELIQHVTQISILLTKLPRKNPDEPKREIGFHEQGPDAT